MVVRGFVNSDLGNRNTHTETASDQDATLFR